MTKIVQVTFWDGSIHRCEVMKDTDIYIAMLEALSDLAHKGIFREPQEIKSVEFDIIPDNMIFD